MDKTELYALDLRGVSWTKSSKSHDDDPPDNCVEVALLGDGAVALRDSKAPERGDLRFTGGEWAAFKAGVEIGEFDA
jgi:hypothetical protein